MTKKRRRATLRQDTITIKQGYNEFMQDKLTINTSRETLKLYKLHISHFLNTCDLWDVNTCHLSKEHYQQWVVHLQNDPAKNDVTVASYCRSVRAFIYWLQDNQYTDTYPLRIPKYQKTIKVCYTDEELSALLARPTRCSEVQFQTWVFINLICATGMRLSSALSLKVSDIQMKERSIYLQTTKNNKAQVFFISNEMISILCKYITLLDLSDDDYLFCNAEKNRLTKRAMQDNVARYNRSHGVKKTSIHLFRHTFAKNYYSQTKDIYTLSHILGHASIATTEQYLRDLGVNPSNATAFNPQLLYADKPRQKRRRRMIDFEKS